MPKVKPIPDGFHTVTPHLVVKGASKAIEFYKRAFGAEEISRMPGPDGRLMHASIRIGDSILMLADEFPEMGAEGPEAFGGSPVKIHLYVEDVDSFVKNATKAGAKVQMPVQDQFWGDRYGKLEDPFGHQWSVGTRKEDLTPAQVMENAKAMFASAGKGK